jgi:hypothetical protein
VVLYFIDNEIDGHVIRDDVGIQFDGPEAAIRDAEIGLREIAANRIRQGLPVGDDSAIIRNGDEIVARLSMRDAVTKLVLMGASEANYGRPPRAL